jgi:hypothetical protein
VRLSQSRSVASSMSTSTALHLGFIRTSAERRGRGAIAKKAL